MELYWCDIHFPSGMTLCSMPFWLVICFLALSSHGLPSCDRLSSITGFAGIALIVVGMVINSFAASS